MKITTIFPLLLLVLISCNEETTPKSFEEKLKGSWSGILTQEDCCTFQLDININKLEKGQSTATGNYSNTDYTICNNDLWDCEEASKDPANCDIIWAFMISDGQVATFEETPLDLIACAPGYVTLRLLNDDLISYQWVDIDDPDNTANGNLKRQ